MRIKEGYVKDTLRFVYSKIPAWIKHGPRYVKIYMDTCNFISKSEWWSSEELKEYQIIETKKIISYAYKHVQYYRELFDKMGIRPSEIKTSEDINKIPFLTKEIIRKNCDRLISNEYDKKKLLCKFTGGSTGKPAKFYFSRESQAKEDAFVDTLYRRIGFDKKQRTIEFRDVPIVTENIRLDKNIFWKKYPGQNRLIFSHFYLNDTYIPYYLKKIKQYKPEWIISFPSSLYQICRYVKRTGNNPFNNIKGIIFGSETLYTYQLDLFKEIFVNSKIFSVYGNTEMGCIAGTCEKSLLYHLQSQYGYYEYQEVYANKTELITTGFNNYAMPLIRYRTGDLVKISETGCECKRNYDIVANIEGRLQSVLYTSDMRPIFDIGLDNIAFENEQRSILEWIERYQFEQEEYGECILYLQTSQYIDESQVGHLEESIAKHLGGGLNVHIKLSRNIPLTERGKEKLIIQKVTTGKMD